MILPSIQYIRFGLALIITISLSRGEIAAQAALQADIGTAGSDARMSTAVPQGEVRGIAVNGDTGEPLNNAFVFVVGTHIDVTSDSVGRFAISGLERGTHVIKAGAIGYRSAEVTIMMYLPHGFVARLSLMPHAPLPAWCEAVCGNPCGTVVVVVRDALTRRAPTTMVALQVKSDSVRYWDFRQAEEGDSAVVLGAGAGPGPFTVDVAASGYAPWYRDSMPVKTTECNSPISRPRQIWLLPRKPGVD